MNLLENLLSKTDKNDGRLIVIEQKYKSDVFEDCACGGLKVSKADVDEKPDVSGCDECKCLMRSRNEFNGHDTLYTTVYFFTSMDYRQ